MFVSARYLGICARSLRWARRDVLMARHLRCRKWFYDPRMAVNHLDDSAPQPFWDDGVPPSLTIRPGDTEVIECGWERDRSTGVVLIGCIEKVLTTSRVLCRSHPRDGCGLMS